MPLRPLIAALVLAGAACADPVRDATGRLAFRPTEDRANCTAILVDLAAPARGPSAGAGPDDAAPADTRSIAEPARGTRARNRPARPETGSPYAPDPSAAPSPGGGAPARDASPGPSDEAPGDPSVIASRPAPGATAPSAGSPPEPRPSPSGATGKLMALGAGHCVPLPFVPGQALYLGWRPPGRFDQALPVLSARHIPAAPSLDAGISDAVLMELAPRRTGAVALPLGPAPAPGDVVRVVSYPRGDPDAPRDATCPVVARTATTLTLDCPAIAGMSGAPVLVDTPRGPAVAAILTARLPPGRSLALLVTPALLDGK